MLGVYRANKVEREPSSVPTAPARVAHLPEGGAWAESLLLWVMSARRYPDFDWSTPDSGRESVVIRKLKPHTWPSVDLDQRVVAGKNSAPHHSAAFPDV